MINTKLFSKTFSSLNFRKDKILFQNSFFGVSCITFSINYFYNYKQKLEIEKIKNEIEQIKKLF